MPRSACARVCRRHRTEPPHGSARPARADDGRRRPAPQGAARPDDPRANISEALVLSTCNRTEVYAVAERFHGAYSDIRGFLADFSFLPPEEFSDHLYVHYDSAAAAHLMAVTAGLDSAVLGESEIQGQVKRRLGAGPRRGRGRPRAQPAASATRSRPASGPAPRPASPAASPRCRRPRWRWPASASAASPARTVLVLGAGEMGEGMAVALAGAGVAEVARGQPHQPTGPTSSPPGSAAGPCPLLDVPDALGRGRRAAHLHRRRRRR